jgi:hypothetical protein
MYISNRGKSVLFRPVPSAAFVCAAEVSCLITSFWLMVCKSMQGSGIFCEAKCVVLSWFRVRWSPGFKCNLTSLTLFLIKSEILGSLHEFICAYALRQGFWWSLNPCRSGVLLEWEISYFSCSPYTRSARIMLLSESLTWVVCKKFSCSWLGHRIMDT